MGMLWSAWRCVHKILRHMFWNLSRIKWKLYVLLFVVFVVLGWKFAEMLMMMPSTTELTEFAKCPSCYGVTMCPAFMLGQIKLIGLSRFINLLNYVGAKNVLFATYGDQKVVLKQLGHSWELAELDKKICNEVKLGQGCRVSDAMWRIKDIRSLITNLLEVPILSPADLTIAYRSLHVCPSTTSIDILLEKIFQRYKAIGRKILYTNIWTILMMNPEPIILQVLPADEGWPVPHYYGACGRVVVEEYVGDMLTDHYDAPWISRANMAHQLLSAADRFTFGHPHFRFYLTDVSPDNIAVDFAGIVRFIDLENVIVLDKAGGDNGKLVTWDELHVSEYIDCQGCFAFSVQDLCSHHVSDHNFYTVCQELLSTEASPGVMPGGLLHDIPSHVLHSYPQLPLLIQDCARPPSHFDRVVAAQNLAVLLVNITSQYGTSEF